MKRLLTFVVDFDGVLVDEDPFLLDAAIRFFGKERICNPGSHKIVDWMGLNSVEKNAFWESVMPEWEKLPIREDAVIVLTKLHMIGHKIYVATTGGHGDQQSKEHSRALTTRRIANSGIPLEGIFFTRDKKDWLYRQIHHDVIIDDSSYKHFDGNSKNGVKEICFGNTRYNESWEGERILSFYELDRVFPGILVG